MSEHAARILVVHDVPDNVRLLEAVLEERAGDRLSHADRLRVASFRREHARALDCAGRRQRSVVEGQLVAVAVGEPVRLGPRDPFPLSDGLA